MDYHQQIEPAFRALLAAKLEGTPRVSCREDDGEFVFTVTPEHGSTRAFVALFDTHYGFDVHLLPQAFEVRVPSSLDTLAQIETALAEHRGKNPRAKTVVKDREYHAPICVFGPGKSC